METDKVMLTRAQLNTICNAVTQRAMEEREADPSSTLTRNLAKLEEYLEDVTIDITVMRAFQKFGPADVLKLADRAGLTANVIRCSLRRLVKKKHVRRINASNIYTTKE